MLTDKKIPYKYIFNKSKFQLIYVIIFSLVVYFLSQYYQESLPRMQLSIPAFIGTAISILLSFKLNQSYDRWWEARKIWGSIVNDSRSLVVQMQNFIASGNELLIKKIAHRQAAWCFVLGQSLRGLEPFKNTENLITEEDLLSTSAHNNKALAIIQLHAQDFAKLKKDQQLETFYHVQIDNTLVRLCESMGKAERIKGTIFPLIYRIFLHFAIYLFIATFVIALSNFELYFQLPLSLLISIIFLMLEKTSTHMQDPFENRPTDTAMTTIARNIEINIKQMLGEKEIPPPYPENDFYRE